MAPPHVLIGLLAFVYIFNLPFGYWRAATKKLTKEWALAVHLPVPVIFALRVVYGVGLYRSSYSPSSSANFQAGV